MSCSLCLQISYLANHWWTVCLFVCLSLGNMPRITAVLWAWTCVWDTCHLWTSQSNFWLFYMFSVMAAGTGADIVSEFLGQNPHLVNWVESLRGYCETNKQWHARREFVLRNMEAFPTIKPGTPSPTLDRLLSLSMVWANHVFLGCR